MKMTNKFLFSVFLVLVAGPAFAKGKEANNMLDSWGGAAMSYCSAHNIDDACIGNSLGGCKNWNNGARSPNRGTADDEMATLMLVARDINENGAKFCVTQVQGANKNKGNAWTVYYNPAGNITKCFWLCKDGHSGDGCGGGVATTCDSGTILKKDFATYKLATSSSAPSVEGEIAMFHWDHNKGCGVHKKQEHDMILAVSGWTPSGHGAFVRPTVVRAERSGWKDMVSTATMWFAGTPTLLCKTGYKPNGGQTDCEPINKTECDKNSLCPSWADGGFDATKHVLKDKDGCFEYRCSAAGTAFASTTDRSCVECTGDNRVGVPDSTGVCVKCQVGKIFDNNYPSSGYCRDAAEYSTNALSFGTGNNRNTELNRQCWTKIEPDEYKDCVTGTNKTGK